MIEAYQRDIFKSDKQSELEERARRDSETWIDDIAIPAIYSLFERDPDAEIATDDLWRAVGDVTPPDLRSMGPALKRAEKLGIIELTGGYRNSSTKSGAKILRLWRRKR